MNCKPLAYLSLLVPALLTLAAPPASAGPRSAPPLERRISVDLERAPAADVLNSFGAVLETPVEIADGVEGKVTVRLEEVTVKTVMTAVCESIGCTWDLAGTEAAPVLRFEPVALALRVRLNQAAALNERVDMSLAGAAAQQVLSSFAGMLECELRVECDEAAETVSIELEDVTLRDAIDRVCSAIGCVCLYEPGVLTVR